MPGTKKHAKPASDSAGGNGPVAADVLTLAEWDLMIEQLRVKGRRYLVRPAADAEMLPPEWTE